MNNKQTTEEEEPIVQEGLQHDHGTKLDDCMDDFEIIEHSKEERLLNQEVFSSGVETIHTPSQSDTLPQTEGAQPNATVQSQAVLCNSCTSFNPSDGVQLCVGDRVSSLQRDDLKMICLLSRGYFGEVHKAQWGSQSVAVKIITPGYDNNQWQTISRARYIKRELEILASVNHDRIVKLLGLCIDDLNHQVLMITEFVSGGTLRDKIKSGQLDSLSWHLKAKILEDVAEAMRYLHDKGKPNTFD